MLTGDAMQRPDSFSFNTDPSHPPRNGLDPGHDARDKR
jgi:hypothetical protein